MNFEFLQLQPELFESGQWLGVLSGIIVTLVGLVYAWQIFATSLRVNIATWGMILFMDIVGLTLALKIGNSQPYMHVGWVFSDILICIAALVNQGNWKWTKIESISLFFCLIAVTMWVETPSMWSVAAYLTACFFALLPQARYYWFDESNARKSAWIWFASSTAIVLTIFAIPVITSAYLTVSLGLLTMYITMAYLAYR